MTNRFLIIVRDEESFAEKTTLGFTYAKLIVLVGGLFLVCMALSFVMLRTVLSSLNPSHTQKQTTRQVIALNHQLDSLEATLLRQNAYMDNIRRVLTGQVDSAQAQAFNTATDQNGAAPTNDLAPTDSAFRAEFEESGEADFYFRRASQEELIDIYFFKPVEGVVSRGYDPSIAHYGTDVVAKKNEPIKATADGTVILSSWTQDSGYVIGIQHKNQIISFYKHNAVLLKEVGDVVQAGDIIAIIGNSGELTDGPHLHFELWYDGKPLDPQEFILY